ncbi:MAG: hypothetical protein GY785_07160 [Gammaproteobacteria bacterium]|nr:hypothetical protein [Gammaproteobacteria bacterium]
MPIYYSTEASSLVKGVAGTLFGSINLKRGDSSYLHTQLYSSLRELTLDGGRTESRPR